MTAPKSQSDRKRKMYADRRAQGWRLIPIWFTPDAWRLLQERRAENPDLNVDQVIERQLRQEVTP